MQMRHLSTGLKNADETSAPNVSKMPDYVLPDFPKADFAIREQPYQLLWSTQSQMETLAIPARKAHGLFHE